MESYDAIVVGVGGMGALACWQLARRGARVLGIEQHTLGHGLGSSHGESRLYRRAYFEAPGYVPLMDRALVLWRELEAETETSLAVQTGLVLFGPPGGSVIAGAELASREHGLVFERVDAAAAARRFPGFRADADAEVLFEPDAGFLKVDACVRVAARAAREHGARICEQTTVRRFEADPSGVSVETDAERFSARSLVLAAGPWSGALAGSLARRFEVRRKVLLWVRAAPEAYRLDAGSPAFGFETREGFFYGFPALEPGVVKLALHTGGAPVADPSALDRTLEPSDVEPLLAFVSRHLPAARAEIVRSSLCMYTMSPDEHFVVGAHPDFPRVFLAAGMSGHGFKFASAIGCALADLAIEGATALPIAFLDPGRFAD